jgi:hypothetical protein
MNNPVRVREALIDPMVKHHVAFRYDHDDSYLLYRHELHFL